MVKEHNFRSYQFHLAYSFFEMDFPLYIRHIYAFACQKPQSLQERGWEERNLIIICGHPCKEDESAPVVAEVADDQCPNRSF
jgi:hypothetical protein